MKFKKNNLLTGFGLSMGLLSGAVAAYFLAPRKGEHTQKMLVEKANRLSQKTIQKLEEGLIQFEIALEKPEDYPKINR